MYQIACSEDGKSKGGKRQEDGGSTNGESAWKSPSFDREAVLTGLGRHEWAKQTEGYSFSYSR
jgi:hypothetical protein